MIPVYLLTAYIGEKAIKGFLGHMLSAPERREEEEGGMNEKSVGGFLSKILERARGHTKR